MKTTYTLTHSEAAQYDSDDDTQIDALRASLRTRFGRVSGGDPVTTEVRHPDGFTVEAYTQDSPTA